ncbi:MAG: DUF6263 family protein [Bacteroidota bacterium]
MKYLSLLVLVCTFAACKSTGPATSNLKGGKVLLRLTDPGDEPLNYVMKTEQEISSMAMGMVNKQKVLQEMAYRYAVSNSKTAGDLEVQFTLDGVKVEQSGFENVSYDSKTDDDPSSTLGKMYVPVLGHSMNMTLSPTGAVKELSGGNAMIDKMFSAEGLGLSPDQIGQLKATMKMQFGNDALKQTMAQTSDIFPEDPVKVGDTWTKSMAQSSGMGLVAQSTFTLDKIEAGKVYISFEGTLATSENSEPMDMVAMKVSYDLEGTQKGNIIVDESNGWVIQSVVNQDFGGDMVIEMDQLPAPMDATMDALSTITFERQK